MKSEIKLYSDIPLTIDRNFAVDDIEEFLENHGGSYWRTSGNYFKHSLDASILLELKQEELDFNATNADSKNYNYCVIYNYNDDVTPIAREEVVYYFITNKKWRSKNVVELELYMDTIATLGWLKLTDRTLVHREHRDRYSTGGGYATAAIDRVQEGVNPILFKKDETVIKEKLMMSQKWYIVYRSQNDIEPTDYNQVNPLDIFVLPEYPTALRLGRGAAAVGSTFAPGKWYSISTFNNPNGMEIGNDFYFSGANFTLRDYPRAPNMAPNVDRVYEYVRFQWQTAGNTVTIELLRGYVDADKNLISYVIVDTMTTTTHLSWRYAKSLLSAVQGDSASDINNPAAAVNFTALGVTYSIDSIDKVDRTDSKINKIVEIPYCPFTYVNESGGYINLNNATGNGSFNSGSGTVNAVKLPPFTTRIDANFETQATGILSEFSKLKFNLSTLAGKASALRSADYEPKLLSSECYSKKLVYDSFNMDLKFEEMDITTTLSNLGGANNYVPLKIIYSLAITSKFAFSLEFIKPKKSTIDYDNILLVARNNELPLYTNQYLNYLRTGLQYDLKNKERQEKYSMVTTSLAGVGAIAGATLGIASGNPAMAIGGIISAGTSVTSAVAGAINQAIATQQAMESKWAQLKAQATNVSATDDLPLLDYYTSDNKAKFITYTPSDTMQTSLENLFYYTGYRTEVMKKPILDTRLRFNYIQADIDIELTSISNTMRNISDEILKDYKARFAAGLTIFHQYLSNYDFEQKYENWETVFKNYLS